jgi:AcrR family transcriptional regulator
MTTAKKIENQTEIDAKRVGRPRDAGTRSRILDAVVTLVVKNGFANTTPGMIAALAGTSKASIYRWWPNKAAVLIEAFVERISQVIEAKEPEDLEEFVRHLLRNYAKILIGPNGSLLRAIVVAAQSDPEVREAYQTHWVKPRRKRIHAILREFRSHGKLAAGADIDQILDAMYGTLQFMLLAYPNKLSLPYAEKLATLVLHGIAQPDGGRVSEF